MKYPLLTKLYTRTKIRSSETENQIRTGTVQFDAWEQTLQELEPAALQDFIKKAENWDFTDHRIAGLKGLSELMNEAKGYVFLKKSGCGEIKFIPAAMIKTPDIEAKCETGKIILEVKTVNQSEENNGYVYWNSYNNEMTMLDVQTILSNGLKNKLDALCKNTVEKFKAYDKLDAKTRHILFCVVELDTNFRHAREKIRGQLGQYLRGQLDKGIELELIT